MLLAWLTNMHTILKFGARHTSTFEIPQKVSEKYNKSRESHPKQRGDFISSKFSMAFERPYIVQAILTPVTVSLDDPENRFLVKQAHYSALKL
ncbi:hypothetical protein PR048_019361 [Dryococelus australis]|uniref:Uncharacterized protein n=1 Tax=Dryococelus australis TaxID=614101 RepID=A0ABQ9H3A1_9NEOP|nr:hypothetical protein PR048_019361 [Dryococelus australis]